MAQAGVGSSRIALPQEWLLRQRRSEIENRGGRIGSSVTLQDVKPKEFIAREAWMEKRVFVESEARSAAWAKATS
jgi:hypothetical protein